MMPRHFQTARARFGGKWFRRLRRGVRVLACLVALCTALALFGWRYGFMPLPKPVPGWTYRPPQRTPLAQLPRGCAADWLVQLGQLSVADSPGQHRLGAAVNLWCNYGGAAVTNRDVINGWLQHYRLVRDFGELALAATNCVQPVLEEPLIRGRRLAVQCAFWRAAEAERATNSPQALLELTRVWRLRYSLGSSHEADWNAMVAWRRIVLAGPPISRVVARQFFAELDAVANALPTFAEAYREQMASESVNDWLASVQEEPGGAWDDVASEFRETSHRILQDLAMTPERLARLFGEGQATSTREVTGPIRLLGPIRSALELAARQEARPNDLRQVRMAIHSQILSRAERGEIESALAWEQQLRQRQRDRWTIFRIFDRPAAWRVATEWPEARSLDRQLRNVRAALEICRVLLALRLYRDQHGAWPERLEQLTPDFLAVLPPDPFGGRPFHFLRHEDRWLLWSEGAAARLNSSAQQILSGQWPIPADLPACVSDDWTRRWRDFQQQQSARAANPPVMDIRMMLRYGLVPKGFKITTDEE